MEEDIRAHINDPQFLESLYRDKPAQFKKAFNVLFNEVADNPIAQVWHERLNYEEPGISWGSNGDLIFVIIASFIAGWILKLPDYGVVDEDYFFTRNLSFVFFPFLIAYFLWKNNAQLKHILIISALLIVSLVYINLLPESSKSDTLYLAEIHLPLFLWALTGAAFVGNALKDTQRRIAYLTFNGELLIMSAIILITGGLLVGLSYVLFDLIHLDVDEIYQNVVVVWGFAAIPIVATYLVLTNPQLVNRVTPIISRIFTPLVFITLLVFLIAMIVTGEDPYTDRDFLMTFNVVLISVMAIVFFSIAGTLHGKQTQFNKSLLLALSIVTIIVNVIALSAIVFRIGSYGFTPNRIAVLGGNVLMLINLCMVAFQIFNTLRKDTELSNAAESIAKFLPVYSAWTVFVTFLMPMILGFR